MKQDKYHEGDIAYYCKHFNRGYCKKIKHLLENGYAIAHHCKKCKYFEFK